MYFGKIFQSFSVVCIGPAHGEGGQEQVLGFLGYEWRGV